VDVELEVEEEVVTSALSEEVVLIASEVVLTEDATGLDVVSMNIDVVEPPVTVAELIVVLPVSVSLHAIPCQGGVHEHTPVVVLQSPLLLQ